jgi:hypothetical protein
MELARDIPHADIVTLDLVICCYPYLPALPAAVRLVAAGHTNAAIGQRLFMSVNRPRSTCPASTPRWTSKDAQTSLHRSRPLRTASSASTGFLERSRPAQGSASARAEISGDAHPGEKVVGHPGGSSISHR